MGDVPCARVVSGRPFIGRDKIIHRAVLDLGELHLPQQVPRFPPAHLPNEMRHLGMAGIAGQARLKAGQHRGRVTGTPIQEEQPARRRRMRSIPRESSTYGVFHGHLLRERARVSPSASPVSHATCASVVGRREESA